VLTAVPLVPPLPSDVLKLSLAAVVAVVAERAAVDCAARAASRLQSGLAAAEAEETFIVLPFNEGETSGTGRVSPLPEATDVKAVRRGDQAGPEPPVHMPFTRQQQRGWLAPGFSAGNDRLR